MAFAVTCCWCAPTPREVVAVAPCVSAGGAGLALLPWQEVHPAVSTTPLMCLPAGSSVPPAVIVSGWQETQAVSPPLTVGWFATGGTPWQRPQAASPVPTLVQVGAVFVPSP